MTIFILHTIFNICMALIFVCLGQVWAVGYLLNNRRPIKESYPPACLGRQSLLRKKTMKNNGLEGFFAPLNAKGEWCIARHDTENWSIWTTGEDFYMLSLEFATTMADEFRSKEPSARFEIVSLKQAIELLREQTNIEDWEAANPRWTLNDILSELDANQPDNSGS